MAAPTFFGNSRMFSRRESACTLACSRASLSTPPGSSPRRGSGGGKQFARLRGESRLDSAYVIPRNNPAVDLLKDGPKGWSRFRPQESCARPAGYVASAEAMEGIRDLLLMPRASLDKQVKEWSGANCNLPQRQYDQVRIKALPERWGSVARPDGQAKARENVLMSIGAALNYSITGAIRVSETVVRLDDLVPNLEAAANELATLHPPIYVPPTTGTKSSPSRRGWSPASGSWSTRPTAPRSTGCARKGRSFSRGRPS